MQCTRHAILRPSARGDCHVVWRVAMVHLGWRQPVALGTRLYVGTTKSQWARGNNGVRASDSTRSGTPAALFSARPPSRRHRGSAMGKVIPFPVKPLDDHELRLRIVELVMAGERDSEEYRRLQAERQRREQQAAA
jgi:hypothetical protein